MNLLTVWLWLLIGCLIAWVVIVWVIVVIGWEQVL